MAGGSAAGGGSTTAGGSATAGGAATAGGTAGGTSSGGGTGVCSPTTLLTGATALAAGAQHACVIGAGGGVWCWGANIVGQAGAPLTTEQVRCARRVSGTTTPALTLAANDLMTCTRITSTSPIECWGDRPAAAPSPTPTAMTLTAPQANGLAVGDSHVCVSEPGTVSCTGDNSAGQLGPGTGTMGGVLDPAPRSTCAGTFHTCLARADGGVDCWGRNDLNQVQPGATASYSLPQRVTLSAAALEVKCGRDYSCARLVNNELWCWGDNLATQLSAGSASSPVLTSAGSVSAVGAGDQHLCFVRSNAVWCRGKNNVGQCAGTTSSLRANPEVQVAGLPGGAPDELALGIDFSCARYPNGDVWCWGLDDLNQLGSADAGGFAPRRVQLMQ